MKQSRQIDRLLRLQKIGWAVSTLASCRAVKIVGAVQPVGVAPDAHTSHDQIGPWRRLHRRVDRFCNSPARHVDHIHWCRARVFRPSGPCSGRTGAPHGTESGLDEDLHLVEILKQARNRCSGCGGCIGARRDRVHGSIVCRCHVALMPDADRVSGGKAHLHPRPHVRKNRLQQVQQRINGRRVRAAGAPVGDPRGDIRGHDRGDRQPAEAAAQVRQRRLLRRIDPVQRCERCRDNRRRRGPVRIERGTHAHQPSIA
ncbi:hypothetical protein GALL_456360 [mine drainage metagenome]|uniref:Uncharacterized protein n=1 Tax=mine drainage metagenome TaxID=410659 RepID=A0A1J5PMG8_9ZZZZ